MATMDTFPLLSYNINDFLLIYCVRINLINLLCAVLIYE